MLAGLLLLFAPPSTVRAEPVEAPFFLSEDKSGPSTSSGRTEVGDMSPIDAERAFAADAKTIGQWTAFRKWSTDAAVMFTPQPVNAHDFLKDRKDPAKAVEWWPTASYISCDGTLAVNTGGWQRPDGKVGYFSTVWQRQPDGGWKWIVDGGADLKVARARLASPKIVRAVCPSSMTMFGMGVKAPKAKWAGGFAKDGTLSWTWIVDPDGSRAFMVDLNQGGNRSKTVILDKIPAAK